MFFEKLVIINDKNKTPALSFKGTLPALVCSSHATIGVRNRRRKAVLPARNDGESADEGVLTGVVIDAKFLGTRGVAKDFRLPGHEVD